VTNTCMRVVDASIGCRGRMCTLRSVARMVRGASLHGLCNAWFARSGPTGGHCWVCRACKGAAAYAATAFAAIAAAVGAPGRPRATLPDRGMPARPPQPPVCQRRRQNAGRRAADPRQKRGRWRRLVNAEQFLGAGGARAKARPPMGHTLCGAAVSRSTRMPAAGVGSFSQGRHLPAAP